MTPSEKQGSILITGSSGFIGDALARRFGERYRIAGLDAKPPSPTPDGRGDTPAEYFYVDLTSDDSVEQALTEVRRSHGDHLASVIHLAAYYDFAGDPSPLYEEVTVRGTERLLQGLRRHFQVEQFAFSSSTLVYAPCEPGQRINEDSPLEPKWDYPESKVRTEELLRADHAEIPLVILRIAGVYDDLCHSIPLAHHIQRIYERQLVSHVFPGDTSHGQPFLHLADLVEALWLTVEQRRALPPEETLLVGEPETMSYEELQREFGLLIHGEEWETRQIPKAVAKAGAWLQDVLPGEEPFIKPWMIDLADEHQELDITRARTLLGWEPRHRLRDTLFRMIGALKRDPAGWYRLNKLEVPQEVAEQEQPEQDVVAEEALDERALPTAR
jgi:nucleoside-diphosphate-sugar epimerase